jgi:ABC-type nickel/cobalt efflux system permease component RcnA
MTLSIIATANHWWIDAVAAAFLVLGAVAVWRVLHAWMGDRRWSWARMRFQPEAGIAQLESHANEHRCEHAGP